MVLPVPGIEAALPFLSKLGGGGSKSTSTSSVASNVDVLLQNVIGGSAAPQSGGSASSTPSFIDSTTPSNLPPYLNGNPQAAIGSGANTPNAGETDSFFSDPLPLILGLGGAIAVYFLVK